MRALLVLFVIALLGVVVAGCGGTGEDTGSVSRTSSDAITRGGNSTRAAASTSTAGGGAGALEPSGPYETAGTAASEADKLAVTAVVKRYYAAVAADDGAQACLLIYPPFAKSVAEDYGRLPDHPYLRGKTCAVVMSKIFSHRHDHPTSDVAGIEVSGVRISSSTEATALLHSPTMSIGEISLHREGDTWTMEQLLGHRLR